MKINLRPSNYKSTKLHRKPWMSFSQGSIFKPRQSKYSGAIANGTSESNELSSVNNKAALELTKNKKYCVSRLPALPSVLENSGSNHVLNGYSDFKSNHALAINEKAIHVWKYNSTDSTPLSIQFPLESGSNSILPLGILTNPSSGTSQDPGLVIIDSSLGLVKFYESVQHAPALGLINNKSLELTIPINHTKGEYITLAENVEPAGIAVATSWKRCVLISLRDFKSKPQLSCTELLGASHSGGFLSSIISGFGRHSDYNEIVKDEIVSIKSGRIVNNGMSQEIIVQDSMGGFNLFSYNLYSAHSVPYVEKRKTLKQNLGVYLENNIDGFLPGSSLNTKFLDLWPLESQGLENIYLSLCLIDETYRDKQGKNLLLVTMKIDDTGALFYGSHKLIRYDPNLTISSTNKPKLYVPNLGKTAFVTLDNSVILTDINTSYIHSQGSVQYYKPRWEDLVKLKANVQIVGQGYENQSANTNPAVILLTSNSGVLRVERFPDSTDDDMDIEETLNVVDPVQVAKSHIEQAIFYSQSTSIEFDISEEYSDEVILSALRAVLVEILDSTSPYLPEFLPSIKDFLSMKSKLYHELIQYTKRNFMSIWSDIAPQITECLEKTEVALNFWIFIHDEPSKTEKLINIFKECVIETGAIKNSNSEDLSRKFFSQGLSSINEVLTAFIERLVKNDYSLVHILQLIVKTMYDGVYENDKRYIIGSNLPSFKSWVFQTSLLLRIEEVFSKVYCSQRKDYDHISTQQSSYVLVRSCEILYYFVTSAITFMQHEDNSSEQLKEYLRWYKSRKYDWISALINHSLDKEAIEIAEKYHDLSSLAQILEAEKSQILEKHGEDTMEYQNLLDKYSYYFEKFGYEFASSLFDFYIKTDKVQSLLFGFENQGDYVKDYFNKNSSKTSDISWIRNLLDKDFTKASEALVDSAQNKNDDLQDNKELKYSIAKLSAIASQNSDSIDKHELDDILYDVENNLILIRVQKHLYQELLNFVSGQKGLLNLDYVLKNFVNDSLDINISKKLLDPFFSKFLENRPLTSNQLITMLTTIKPYSGFVNGFSNALKVASLITNENEYKLQARFIWLKLLTTTDDWSRLAKTENKTDEYTKQKIHDSMLFKTISSLGVESELLNELDDLLLHYTDSLDDENMDDDLRSLYLKCLNTLQTYITNYDLKTWIKSIKQEVKNNNSINLPQS